MDGWSEGSAGFEFARENGWMGELQKLTTVWGRLDCYNGESIGSVCGMGGCFTSFNIYIYIPCTKNIHRK